MSYPEVMNEVTEVTTPEAETETVEESFYRELNATDRCDTCGAQAFHLVVIPHSGDKLTEMIFCNHHFNKYDKLAEKAIFISSQLEKLNVKPSASSPD